MNGIVPQNAPLEQVTEVLKGAWLREEIGRWHVVHTPYFTLMEGPGGPLPMELNRQCIADVYDGSAWSKELVGPARKGATVVNSEGTKFVRILCF
ncbi:MAG: hypothetical protein VZQ81_09350 [Succiniclasticum sp.]|nr:hypothetical protein [Succiniclasticum sp.]